jgi:hypothetical protein
MNRRGIRLLFHQKAIIQQALQRITGPLKRLLDYYILIIGVSLGA